MNRTIHYLAFLALGLGLALTCARKLHAYELSAADRHAIETEWLLGRFHDIDARLAVIRDDVVRDTTARDLFPLAIRTLWWRPTANPDQAERFRRVGLRSGSPAYGALYANLLDGASTRAERGPRKGFQKRDAGTPWALSPQLVTNAAQEDWPLLTALVLDRIQRENAGASLFLRDSPLSAFEDAQEARIRYPLAALKNDRVFHYGNRPASPEEQKRKDLAIETGKRNALLAGLALLILFLVPYIWVRVLERRTRKTTVGG